MGNSSFNIIIIIIFYFSIYNEALEIDPRNKGTNARLLASRAELLAKVG